MIEREQAVAFISYTSTSTELKACEINALYCLPETQGKRFEELLVNEVIKNTIAVEGNRIFVVLTKYNGPVGLFERRGFRPLETRDQGDPGHEILVMECAK